MGRHVGLELVELDRVAVEALITLWLPDAKALPKPMADDKRLITALRALDPSICFLCSGLFPWS